MEKQRRPATNTYLLKRTDGTALTLNLSLAEHPLARLKGLLGRRLKPAEGIWISPCNSVHSFFMGYAIDLVYLNGSHQVIAIRPGLKPWGISLCGRAKSVIELASGECLRLGIYPGAQLIKPRHPSNTADLTDPALPST